ncbi:MAG: DUF1440 domain-containing protein [Gemmatimonadota bacterium]|jgi:hypothetical protein|nr:DUF1440 domain-containing protein [Gemmatimonadota bacterium]
MRRADQGRNGDLITDLVKGAIAGAVGTWAMNRVANTMYEHEGTGAFLRDKAAQTGGEYATTVAARKAAGLADRELSHDEAQKGGLGIHWAIGIGFGMAHAALRDRVPGIGIGHGLVHGTILFLLVDEAAKPLLGLSGGPTEFPWQAHARGLAGHLVLGGVTDATLDLLDRAS